ARLSARPRAERAVGGAEGDVSDKERREDAMNVNAAAKPMTRRELAKRLADDVPEGWYVNLGIGAPLQVADYVPQEREVGFQSQNRGPRLGPAPEPDQIHPRRIHPRP